MTKKELENEVEMLRARVAVLEAITRDYWTRPIYADKETYPGHGPFYKVNCGTIDIVHNRK